jgi:CubicO group peptidase (beta-lactamase class C family)
LVLAAACTLAGEATGQSKAAVADVPKLMREGLVPGLQLGLVADGRVDVLPFGVADVRTGAPVTEATVFEAASLGKPVLSYGLLRLASDGRIDLDAPIGRYLPDLGDDLAKVTARRLLTHSAGLSNGPSRGGEFVLRAADTPRFSYSGEGFDLLQKLVERISGKGLQDYMASAVFEPLGMTSSSYTWRSAYADTKAFGHRHTGSSAGRNRISQARAASSLETSAGDYARFLIAAVRGTGIRADLARQFLQPQIALEEGCAVCVGKPTGSAASGQFWGLGFGVAMTSRGPVAWHWGDNETMQSYAAIRSDGRRGLVILTNSANGHSIARRIATSVLGFDAPGYAWLGSYASYEDRDRHLLGKVVREGADAVQAEDLRRPRMELLQVAERLIAGDMPDTASALLKKVIGQGPAGAAESAFVAEALRRQGMLAEARQSAAAALRLDPANKRALVTLERLDQMERRIPAERLARFAGLYSSPFGPLEVKTDGRSLRAQLLDQPESALLPISHSAFLMEDMGVPIEFVTGADGAVTHAVVRAGGEIRLERMSAPAQR